ncbi:MAG TPA: cupredoxin domain-containing protein [Burkholderiales bacterium]|nr:cupredoxin domain-containing protein [Burkholderiales bacterium]
MNKLAPLAKVLTLSVLSCPVMAADTIVDISQFAFTPVVEVPAGTKIVWVNRDKVNHSVIGDAGTFNSGSLKPDDSFSHTFAAAGTYAYHCGYHAYMNGVIVVK